MDEFRPQPNPTEQLTREEIAELMMPLETRRLELELEALQAGKTTDEIVTESTQLTDAIESAAKRFNQKDDSE